MKKDITQLFLGKDESLYTGMLVSEFTMPYISEFINGSNMVIRPGVTLVSTPQPGGEKACVVTFNIYLDKNSKNYVSVSKGDWILKNNVDDSIVFCSYFSMQTEFRPINLEAPKDINEEK